MESRFFLRLLSTLLFFFSQDQRAAPYSFENCEVHAVLRGRTKVLCYNRNLAKVPSNLPSKLDLLDLSQNNISSLGKSDFRQYSHLRILNISQNKIQKIEMGTFIYTNWLESLNLTTNQLSFLYSSIFDGLVNLTTLLLGNNQISGIEPSAFADLKKLKVIDLSSNRLRVLTSMNALLNVESLEELHIRDNGLQNFSTKDIISMPKQLRELDASRNSISLIDVATPVLQNLSSFNLSFPAPKVSTVWLIENPCFLRGLKTLFLGGIGMKPSEISELIQKLNCSLLETIHLNQLNLSTSDDLIEQVCLWQQNVKTLNLEGNLFTSMKTGIFENCTHLKHLNMAFNKLQMLPVTLFQSLHSLQVLQLANNKFTSVPNATSNLTSLQGLDLSFNKIDSILPIDFVGLNNVTSLSITGNHIFHLQSDLFSSLPRLQELNLQNNILTEIKGPFSDSLKMLETLILSQNNLNSISKGTFRYLISLKLLNLADNRIAIIEHGAFEGLSNLQNLVLGSNKITRQTLQEGVFEGASSLGNLQLFNNYISYDSSNSLEKPPFTSLKSLKKLDINSQRHNGLKNFPVNLLQGLESIVQIHAGNLAVSFLDPKTFSYTPTLQELDLSSNNILNVNSDLFHPVPNLTELHINRNGLNSLNFVLGVNFSKLTLLRVAKNQIDMVTEMQVKALPYLLFLDLRQNPFICSCSNEMFLNWSLHDPKTQVLHFYQYTCASPPTHKGQKLWTFQTSSCTTNYEFILFVTTTTAVVVLMFVCLLYEWRLHMLYTYHLLLAYFIDKRQKRKGMRYDYDAFLSYNTHDEEWVMNELLPMLEGQYCWRLCLHHRDFEPGRSIIENIVDNIYASRKTICVVSRHYLESEWCSKEIQVASFRLFDEYKDVLVLILLDEIPNEYLSPYHRMRKLMKKKTYLKWPQDEKKIPLFWQKLNMALKTGEGKEDENPILDGFIPHEVP